MNIRNRILLLVVIWSIGMLNNIDESEGLAFKGMGTTKKKTSSGSFPWFNQWFNPFENSGSSNNGGRSGSFNPFQKSESSSNQGRIGSRFNPFGKSGSPSNGESSGSTFNPFENSKSSSKRASTASSSSGGLGRIGGLGSSPSAGIEILIIFQKRFIFTLKQ